jgi:hypothetical protein
MKKDRKYASVLLDKLIALDKTTQSSYYEMGRILQAIHRDKLYDVLGYTSLSNLVEEELSFTPTTAASYRHLYERFRVLKYNKNESIQLLNEFGFTAIGKVLPKIKTKVGKRAIKNKIDELDEHQVNFCLTNKEYFELCTALEAFGACKSELSGRYMNSSEALMQLIRSTIRKKAA